MARRRSQTKLLTAAALCLWLAAVACASSCVDSSRQDSDAGEPQGFEKIPDSVRRDLEAGRTRDVVIELFERDVRDASVLDADASLERSLRPASDDLKDKAERYRSLQERVLEQAAGTSTHLRFQYVNLPMLHMQVDDLRSLLDLAQLPEVRAVYEDVQVSHDLTESWR